MSEIVSVEQQSLSRYVEYYVVVADVRRRLSKRNSGSGELRGCGLRSAGVLKLSTEQKAVEAAL